MLVMSKIKKSTQRRITIKDIAALAKVSIGTVDRVLHNRGEVNQETHDRVMAFVEELGYTPNLLAKSLALKKHFMIAALIPDGDDKNPYWKKPMEGLMGASDELKDFNTKIDIFNYDAGEASSFEREFNRIITLRPDGIIMAPNFHDTALRLIPICRILSIPLMFIDNNLDDGHGLAYFGQDAFQSGVVAAKLMHYGLPGGATVLILNLARNKAITRHMQHRENGFGNYFNKVVPGHGIKTVSRSLDLSLEKELFTAMDRILSEQNDIAGIFVTNSRVHKVAGYLSTRGKKGIMLIGYDLVDDNIDFMKKGIIDFLICQKPEDQGYRCGMAMFNFLLTGKLTDKINYSPIDIITKENIDYYK
jgi:LacI family transcriptional regulator